MNATMSFTHDDCYLQGHFLKGPPLLLGSLVGGLYHLKNSFKVQTTSSNASSPSPMVLKYANTSIADNAQLWHIRLGHLPFSQLKYLLDVNSSHNQQICQICPLAKQARLSFPVSSIKTTKPFELLHIDLWGPYKVKNHNNCNQFVTIVDDFSRFTWVHLIKYKSEVSIVIPQFAMFVATQFDATIKCIRTDNALELCAGTMKDFYLSKGIRHESSCPHTPQQNGVVERKHRHILDTARALFFQAKLPPHYWGEALLCATYLLNRMPLRPLHHSTPYQLLYNTPPSLDHLKAFGCLCYVSTSLV